MNILFAIFSLLGVYDFSLLLHEATPFSTPNHFEQQFSRADLEFQMRWLQFAEDRQFTLWTPGRSKESLAEEFGNLVQTRKNAWFVEQDKLLRSHPDFAIAEELIYRDCVRESNCIPFNYNKACPYYNGSLVQAGDRRFLAMMGPRDQDVHSFFRLLLDASASALVRLTPAFEGSVSKCHPYWEGRSGDCKLQIPFGKTSYPIPYFAFEGWLDNTGTGPEKLYEFVQKIRKAHNPASGPLAVHCTNGVGRTGTVIAAIALLDEADRQVGAGIPRDQIKVSVEETVLRLSLQRFFMCAQIPQYESLYRVLELYVNDTK